jgi:hypothetical protein
MSSWYMDYDELNEYIQNLVGSVAEDNGNLTISVVTSQEVLEAESSVVFDSMVNLIESGVEIRYFYPEIAEKTGFRYQYEKLRKKYEKANLKNERGVKFLQIMTGNHFLFGKTGQYIIFTVNRLSVQNHELYISVSTVSDQAGKIENIWIRQPDTLARDYIASLYAHSASIENAGICGKYRGKIVERNFLNSFSAQLTDYYRNSHELIQPDHQRTDNIRVFGKLLESIIQGSSALEEDRPFTVLYIGYGDGKNLGRVAIRIADDVSESSIPGTIITAIDASAPKPEKPKKHEVRPDLSIHFHSGVLYENLDPISFGKYDLILSQHSLFYFDDRYYPRLYENLTTNGVAIIILPSKTSSFLGGLESVLMREGAKIRNLTFAEDFFERCKDVYGDKAPSRKILQFSPGNTKAIPRNLLKKAVKLFYGVEAEDFLDRRRLDISDFDISSLEEWMIILNRKEIDKGRLDWLSSTSPQAASNFHE